MPGSSAFSFSSECYLCPVITEPVQRQLLASSAGGIIATLVLSPLGVVKARIQTQGITTLQAVADVHAARGLRGFWAGVGAGLFQTVPSTAMYMVTYEAISEELRSVPALSSVFPAIAGASARTLAVTVMAPVELIRTKQMGGISGSFFSLMRQTVRERGVSGLFRGWTSTVLRDSPFSAIYWLCFESFRPKYRRLLKVDRNGSGANESTGAVHGVQPEATGLWSRIREPLSVFLSGASSGVVAAVFTHPFDLRKTRQQVLRPEERLGPPLPDILTSDAQEGRLLLQEQACKAGFVERTSCQLRYVQCWWRHFAVEQKCTKHNMKGLVLYIDNMFFKGLPLRLAMIIPGGGIMITIYETVKSMNFDR